MPELKINIFVRNVVVIIFLPKTSLTGLIWFANHEKLEKQKNYK